MRGSVESGALSQGSQVLPAELYRRFLNRMLGDILVHNGVVKLADVLGGVVVVQLTAVGLDYVGPIRTRTIRETVLRPSLHGILDDRLVLTGSIFLRDEATGGRLVLLVTRVELLHGRVELLVSACESFCSGWLGEKGLELSLDTSGEGFETWVAELVFADYHRS